MMIKELCSLYIYSWMDRQTQKEFFKCKTDVSFHWKTHFTINCVFQKWIWIYLDPPKQLVSNPPETQYYALMRKVHRIWPQEHQQKVTLNKIGHVSTQLMSLINSVKLTFSLTFLERKLNATRKTRKEKQYASLKN